MSKRNTIIYWVATLWLSLGMVSTGIVQLLRVEEEVAMMNHLGYPNYVMTILGVWKIVGVIAILIPSYSLFKEWAYTGFFLAMSGAIISHIVMGDAITETLPALLLLTLTAVSWYCRPMDRKLVALHN